MSKKKIIGIILFVFVGLFMFTFTNPYENNKKNNEPSIEEGTEQNKEENIDEENNSSYRPAAPSRSDEITITIEPSEIIILLGEGYDVMSGVVVTSVEQAEVKADITDTTLLEVGSHVITYTFGDKVLGTRTIIVLDPEADEDEDGYTNKVESEKETDIFNPESKPVDTTAPEIILKGEDALVLQGEEYIDLGATATDDVDGDITAKIEITSLMDTTLVGEYIVTYTVTDIAGNVATATRTVRVIAPELDDDNDGYTNKEEVSNETNPLDPEVKPVDNAPEIIVEPEIVEIDEGTDYDVMTGVTVNDDFDLLTAISDVTDTTVLAAGEYTITYTVVDRAGNTVSVTRTIKVNVVDKAPVITADNVDANGEPEAIIDVNVVDDLTGVANVYFVPGEYITVDAYKEAVADVDKHLNPTELVLDENGDATITVYVDGIYTIYAVDNSGEESIKTVFVTGIEYDQNDITSDDSAEVTTIEGVTVKVGENETEYYGFEEFLKINPKRDIKVEVAAGYTIEAVKWEEGRMDIAYFQSGNGNEVEPEFILGDSTNTKAYTLYVKATETATNDVCDGIIYIYNNAYWLWTVRY